VIGIIRLSCLISMFTATCVGDWTSLIVVVVAGAEHRGRCGLAPFADRNVFAAHRDDVPSGAPPAAAAVSARRPVSGGSLPGVRDRLTSEVPAFEPAAHGPRTSCSRRSPTSRDFEPLFLAQNVAEAPSRRLVSPKPASPSPLNNTAAFRLQLSPLHCRQRQRGPRFRSGPLDAGGVAALCSQIPDRFGMTIGHGAAASMPYCSGPRPESASVAPASEIAADERDHHVKGGDTFSMPQNPPCSCSASD